MVHLAGTRTVLRRKRAMLSFGDPIEVAGMVAFSCSHKSRYVTRQDIHIICEIDLSKYKGPSPFNRFSRMCTRRSL